MDQEMKERMAAANRKLAAMEAMGADQAKIAELKAYLAGLKETADNPQGPRLVPANPTKPAELQPDAHAEPRPLSRREQTDKAAAKAKDEAPKHK